MSFRHRILLFFVLFTVNAQAQSFLTDTYYIDDTSRLELDLFLPTVKSGDLVPVVLFVHGGGFSGGDRSAGHQLGEALRQRGIAVASISYTLYMKGRTQDWSCNGILTEKVKTIQIAANQVWLATNFLRERAVEWNLNPEQIFISGSSAGGEAVLHAAYWDREQMALYDHRLPADFRYAGMISGAGAIMDLNPITQQTQVPTLLFHGDADPVVPYATAAHHFCDPGASGWLMLFGSGSIADHQAKLGGTYSLITFAGATHSVAGYFFFREQEVVADFVFRVLKGDKFQERVVRQERGRPR